MSVVVAAVAAVAIVAAAAMRAEVRCPAVQLRVGKWRTCCCLTAKRVRCCLLRCIGITFPFVQICEPLLLTGRPPPPLQLREGDSAAAAARNNAAAAAAARNSAAAARRGGVDLSLVFFDVRKADIYMLGVLLFYSWADGAVWTASDPQQDEQ